MIAALDVQQTDERLRAILELLTLADAAYLALADPTKRALLDVDSVCGGVSVILGDAAGYVRTMRDDLRDNAASQPRRS